MALFALIDRRELTRVLKVFGLTVFQVVIMGAGVWLVYRAHAWWALAVWLLVVFLLASAWCVYKMRQQYRRMLLPVVASLSAGLLVAGGSMMACLPVRAFVPVFGVLAAHLIVSVTQTLLAYQRSLMHTAAHRQYLLANGATSLESVMPSVRRALRAAVQPQLRTMAQPLLVAMPLLFAGMLLGGSSPAACVAILLLMMAVAFVASVVAVLVALYCFKR